MNSLEFLAYRFNYWLEDKLDGFDSPSKVKCTGNILCDKENWHKCDYRPVSVNTYVKGIIRA